MAASPYFPYNPSFWCTTCACLCQRHLVCLVVLKLAHARADCLASHPPPVCLPTYHSVIDVPSWQSTRQVLLITVCRLVVSLVVSFSFLLWCVGATTLALRQSIGGGCLDLNQSPHSPEPLCALVTLWRTSGVVSWLAGPKRVTRMGQEGGGWQPRLRSSTPADEDARQPARTSRLRAQGTRPLTC